MGLSSKPQTCLWCGCTYQKDARNLYCSRACSNEAQSEKITVACAFCGKEKSRAPSAILQSKQHFCNLQCQHNQRYYEKTGYVMNDELRENIADLLIEGWSYGQLVECYGLSKSTVARIKKEFFGSERIEGHLRL